MRPSASRDGSLTCDEGARSELSAALCLFPPVIKRLGLIAYSDALSAMRDFTASRDADTEDEIWLAQHPPVYTSGLNAKREHFPRRDTGIPIIASDRGGQITYHGPGQALVYLLLDLKRRKIGVKALVRTIEESVIRVLGHCGVNAHAIPGMPGVYVDGAKICALGLRVARGCCYHGLALNVDVDLAPFRDIDPCGYSGLRVTRTSDLGVRLGVDALSHELVRELTEALSQH
jgi:lipoyl(octanoyl) transferase